MSDQALQGVHQLNVIAGHQNCPLLIRSRSVGSSANITLVELSHVERILDVFFDRVPTWPKALRQSSFKRDLLLPCKHRQFPVSRFDLRPVPPQLG